MKRLCTLSIVSGALVLVSLHFTGCSKTPTIDPVVDLPIGVTLSDQGFTASDGSTGHFSRAFMSGDQAGLFLVRDGQIVEDNVLLSFDGQKWTSEKEVSVSGKETCFVYMPYSASASSLVDKTASDAAGFFKGLAKTQSVEDQSSFNLAEADVMVAAAPVVKTETAVNVNATFEHLLSVAAWSLSDGTAYTTVNGFKYMTPSSYTNIEASLGGKTIVPGMYPSYNAYFYYPAEGMSIKVSYKDAGVDKSFDIPLSGKPGVASFVNEGNVKDGGNRNLAIGDLYYSDGSILPVEKVKEMEQVPSGVAGVIFQTDRSRFSKKEKELLGDVHALVVSAKMPEYDGKTSMKWFDDYPAGKDDGNRDESVEDPNFPGMYLPFITDVKDYKKSYELNNADINGYWNNVVIRTRRAEDMKKGWYPAFSAAVEFGNKVAVPSYTTGWYLPSVGQLYDILRNLGKADISVNTVKDFNGNGDLLVDASYCADMMEFLDSYIDKIPEAERDLFSESTGAVWSSSHSWTYFSSGDISYAARLVSFYAGVSTISYSTFGVADVRLVFAF